MSLTLHHADELEPLLDELAHVLATPLADPFTADVVVVPTAGIRDAVTAHLGSRLGVSERGNDGITANVDLLYIGGFVNRVLGLTSHADEVDPDPWHIARLTWSVLDVLAAGNVSVPVPDITWAFARRVADLFDRYATQRPQLIQEWARGQWVDGVFDADGSAHALPTDHHWQYELWVAVRQHIGVPSLPERLPGLLDAVRSGELRPDLPPRLALVGFGSLAPAQWQVVQALACTTDVHVLLRTPSRGAWNASETMLAGKLVSPRLVADLDVTAPHQHPLVVSWGRRSLEARAFIGGTPGIDIRDRNRTLDDAPTLLRTVQNDIRADRPPTRWTAEAAGDQSLQVHACHGEMRQLEVLRDALGHLFVDHPDLRPHEVVVLCPQLERFAPLVDAVFSRGDMPIPVRVGDRSLTIDDPVADAFQAVLALAAGRVSLSDVLGVLQYAPIRRRFGWSASDVETITSWALEVGTRWGLSPEHRTEWRLPAFVTNGTWRSFVQQLLAGLVHAAPSPRTGIGGVAVFPGLESQAADAIGSFAEFLARLTDLVDAVDHDRPIAEWVPLLRSTLDDFCAPDPDEPWAIADVRAAIDDLLTAATPAHTPLVEQPCAHPLQFADAREMVTDAIRERAGRLSLRSGAVTVTSLRPLHGVPARVVCLLGLDDGSLPTSTFDGDDVLGLNPCIGERNPRHDGRQMLLDSFMAARDAVVITCDGADLTTNAKKPFIVPVAELLDVVAVVVGSTVDDLPIVVRHPRHGFDDRALNPTSTDPLVPGVPRPFTFDSAMLEAATKRRRTLGAPDPAARAARWNLTDDLVTDVDVADLVGALNEPANQLVRTRLDMARMPAAHELDDHLQVGLDPREESAVGRDLVDLARRDLDGLRDWDQVVRDWMAMTCHDGAMPPAAIGDAVLADIADKVKGIFTAAGVQGIPISGPQELTVDHIVTITHEEGSSIDVHVSGLVSGIVIDEESGVGHILDVGFHNDKPNRRLRGAIRLAVCHLMRRDLTWSTDVIVRNSGKGAKHHHLELVDGTASAEALVRMAVEFLWWTRRDAVPFFDESSEALFLGKSPGEFAKEFANEIAYESCEMVWRHLTPTDILEIPVLGTDPRAVRNLPTTSRMRATAQWVWGTVDDCITLETESFTVTQLKASTTTTSKKAAPKAAPKKATKKATT